MDKLTKAEEQIMHLIWEHGATTVSELIKKMPTPHPPHSTVSSLFRKLEKKGYLNYKAYGRTYEYFPIITKKAYSRFSLSGLIKNYFSGSLNEMVSFLVEENDLSLEDLAEITKSIEQKKKK
jgi:predicted transcriptional regulator